MSLDKNLTKQLTSLVADADHTAKYCSVPVLFKNSNAILRESSRTAAAFHAEDSDVQASEIHERSL